MSTDLASQVDVAPSTRRPHGGIEWPNTDAQTGKPSTTTSNKSVWTSALGALTKDLDDASSVTPDTSAHALQARTLQKRIESVPNEAWRHEYVPPLVEFAQIMAMCTPSECVSVAKSGLDALNSLMVVDDGEGGKVSASEAVLKDGRVALRNVATVTVTAAAEEATSDKSFTLYSPRRSPEGKNLPLTFPSAAQAQLKAWSTYGCIEPSAADNAGLICNMDDATALLSNKLFVLLGGTSSLGPAEILLKLGGTVAVVARAGEKLDRLVRYCREEGGRGASLFLPRLADEQMTESQPDGTHGAGADLIDDAPELARWIASLCPEKDLVVSSLAYMDGEKNVRAGVGMDLIVQYVCEHRDNVTLSYILSPSTAHVVPDEAAFDAEQRFNNAPLWQRTFTTLSPLFQPTNTWSDPLPNNNLRILNGLSSIQGPNYALVKSSQQWRAMVEYCAHGRTVSANHGPPSRTANMIVHDKVAAALEGMQSFPPCVAFDILPARSLMAALMLYDINVGSSSANPRNKEDTVKHPMMLFNENSCHGGAWRCPYTLGSMQVASFAMGKIRSGESAWCPEGALAPSHRVAEEHDDRS